jgi:hypothetical protein
MCAGALNVLQSEVARGLICAHRVHSLEALEHGAARLGLFGLLPREVLANEFFGLGNQPLLVLERALLDLAPLFALDKILRVVAGVTNRLTVIYFNDATAGAIEKISIVADDDERGSVRDQELFQPFHRADIQMVCRLVQQQYVGLRKQQTSQPQPVLLASG